MAGEMREIYVWVVDDTTDGREGTIAAVTAATILKGLPITLMARSREAAEALRPLAMAHGQKANRPVRLLRFTGREVIEEIRPKLN